MYIDIFKKLNWETIYNLIFLYKRKWSRKWEREKERASKRAREREEGKRRREKESERKISENIIKVLFEYMSVTVCLYLNFFKKNVLLLNDFMFSKGRGNAQLRFNTDRLIFFLKNYKFKWICSLSF